MHVNTVGLHECNGCAATGISCQEDDLEHFGKGGRPGKNPFEEESDGSYLGFGLEEDRMAQMHDGIYCTRNILFCLRSFYTIDDLDYLRRYLHIQLILVHTTFVALIAPNQLEMKGYYSRINIY